MRVEGFRRGVGRRRWALVGALLMAWAVVATAVAPASRAAGATFTVNSTADLVDVNPGDGQCLASNGLCTLRAAVTEADEASTDVQIDVPAGHYTLTIPAAGADDVTNGDLNLTGIVAITGNPADPASVVIDAGSVDRAIHVEAGSTAAIAGVTVTGGQIISGAFGAGIWSEGALTLQQSVVSGNQAFSSTGGGVAATSGTAALTNVTVDGNFAENGGGLADFNPAAVTVTDSVFSNNTAAGGSGSGLGGGIEYLSDKLMTLTGVALTGNSASNAGGGLAMFNGSVTIGGSTISGNHADAVGGGVETDSGAVLLMDTTTVTGNRASWAGGLDLFAGDTTVTRSLISNNVADGTPAPPGGIHLEGEGGGVLVEEGTTKNLVDVTFSGNSAAAKGGGLRIVAGTVATVNLTQVTMSGDTAVGASSELENDDGAQSTIKVADSIVNGACPAATGVVTSASHNIEPGSSCGFVNAAAGDRQNTDPQLGALGDHGGPTQTLPLAAASPAVDAGSCPASGLNVDQRGVARPQGAACDIGAYERAPGTTVTLGVSPSPSTFGQAVTLTAHVAATSANTAGPSGTVSFLDGASSIGSAPLVAGSAQLTTSALSPGFHDLSASYSGDAEFDPLTSAVVGHTVSPADTTIVLADLSPPTVTGQTVTLGATVTPVAPGAGMPTGPVDFNLDGNPANSVALSGGVASFTTPALAAGTHHIDASYQGDCCFLDSTDPGIDVVVGQASTITALAAVPEPSDPAAAVTLTASILPVAPGAGSPTGMVTFDDAGAPLGTAPLDPATGTAVTTVPGSTLPAGDHLLRATYGGDSGFLGSASPALTHVVGIPAAPALSVSQGPAAGEVTVDWTAPVPGAGITGVRVLRGSDPANLQPVGDVVLPTTTFVDGSLPPGTTVMYAISALTSGGAGAAGAPVTVVVPGTIRALADLAGSVGAVPVTVDVLANDVGAGLAPATVTIVAPPALGSASVGPDQRITVDPDDSVFGPVALLYRVDSPAALPSAGPIIGTLTVDVAPVTVRAQSDGGPVQIDLARQDPNVAAAGVAVRVDLTEPPQHGSADVAATTIRYQPAAGFAGVDTVTYRAVVSPLAAARLVAAGLPGHLSTGRIEIETARVLGVSLVRPPAGPAASPASSTGPVAGPVPAAPAGPPAGPGAAAPVPPAAPDTGPPASAPGRAPATPSARDDVAAGPPGARVRVAGSAPAGVPCSRVSVFFGDDRLGTADVRDGTFRLEASVPGNAATGLHALSFSCHGRDVKQRFPLAPFRVTHASVHRTAFVTSVHLPRSIPLDARNLAVSALLAAALLALVAFPAELFNSTLEANYDEVRGWFGVTRPIKGRIGNGWSTAAVFFAAAGAIYGLLDPGFGLNLSSLAEYAGLVTSLLVVTAAFGLPAVLAAHRRSGQWGTIQVLPGTVVLAAVCVLLSRLLHFQPGYLYGLVAGMSFAGELTEDDEARYSAFACILVLAVSLGAWLVWLPVQHRTSQGHPSFLLLALEAALAATFVSGLESVVVGLLPLRFLEGARIMRWRRSAWAALFGVGLFAFVHVLLRPGAGYVGHSSAASAVTVLAIFALFSLGSVAFWAYFRFRKVQPQRVTT